MIPSMISYIIYIFEEDVDLKFVKPNWVQSVSISATKTASLSILCIEGHEVSILTGGYGLCEICLDKIEGYSDLYKAPKGYTTPGDEYE